MFKLFAAAALVGVALVVPTGSAIAQHHHHGHDYGHLGHHQHGHGHIHLGGLGFGYWPSSYGYYYPGWNYGYYPGWNFSWPYYTYTSYLSNPSAYILGGGPYYFGNGVTYGTPRTTIVTVPNAAAPNAAAAANPRVAARPVEIQFGGFAQFGELSARLVRLANDLCLDLHHNYPHNAGFADTYRAAYQIFETAKFVSANQGDRPEIARRVNELDALFHQVQSDARRFRRRFVRQIAGTGLQAKLNEVETTLHDLMQDVGVMGTHGAPPPAPAPAAPPANAELAPPPPLPAPNPPR